MKKIGFLLFLLLSVSCGSDWDTDCTYAVIPYIIEPEEVEGDEEGEEGADENENGENGIEETAFYQTRSEEAEQTGDPINWDLIGYYFYVDTATFRTTAKAFDIGTFDDCAAGILRAGDITHSYDGKATVEADSMLYFRSLDQYNVVLVLVDPVRKFYAWRAQIIEAGLPLLLTRVYFRLDRTAEYKERGWTIIPPDTDSEEEGEDTGEK